MTAAELCERCGFTPAFPLPEPDKEIRGGFCGDLLSWAMGRAGEGCAWCTVMGSINAVAVASLADAALIVLCHDAVLMEDIAQGERVQAFHLEARRAGAWRTVYTGSLIGHKHLCRLDLPADALALVIDRAEDTPRLRRVVAYTGEGVDA